MKFHKNIINRRYTKKCNKYMRISKLTFNQSIFKIEKNLKVVINYYVIQNI